MTPALNFYLQPIHPQPLCNIMNGTQTVLVLHRIPEALKRGEPCTFYVYCTNPKIRYRIGCMGFFSDELYRMPKGEIKYGSSVELMAYDNLYDKSNFLSGKVVCKFVVEKINKLKWGRWVDQEEWNYRGWNYEHDELLSHTCLSNDQLNNYGKGKPLYALHITALEIIEPLPLSEFYRMPFNDCKAECEELPYCSELRVTHAPQSFMRVLPPKMAEGEKR